MRKNKETPRRGRKRPSIPFAESDAVVEIKNSREGNENFRTFAVFVSGIQIEIERPREGDENLTV